VESVGLGRSNPRICGLPEGLLFAETRHFTDATNVDSHAILTALAV
jgi:hypothetical protein